MRGVGKHLWELESGDVFIERLRADEPGPPPQNGRREPAEDLTQAIWRRIEQHQRERFETSRGLPFTFEVEGAGIWFFRDGRRINRKLARGQVEQAIQRCPLQSTTEIKDLMDYAYLFALLMDPRIREKAW